MKQKFLWLTSLTLIVLSGVGCSKDPILPTVTAPSSVPAATPFDIELPSAEDQKTAPTVQPITKTPTVTIPPLPITPEKKPESAKPENEPSSATATAENKPEPSPAFIPVPNTTTEPVQALVTSPAPVLEKIFSLTARQWEFLPSSITVKKGETIKLSIKSIDVTHGFSLSEFGVNATLKPGESTIVEFVADKVGTFSFFCSVFCGSGHGNMKGTLTVEE